MAGPFAQHVTSPLGVKRLRLGWEQQSGQLTAHCVTQGKEAYSLQNATILILWVIQHIPEDTKASVVSILQDLLRSLSPFYCVEFC